jgi:hypothetical protein
MHLIVSPHYVQRVNSDGEWRAPGALEGVAEGPLARNASEQYVRAVDRMDHVLKLASVSSQLGITIIDGINMGRAHLFAHCEMSASLRSGLPSSVRCS